MADIYDQSYYRGREVWPDFRTEIRTVLRLARLSRDSSVLEVGCGSGELLRALGAVAGKAAGVDLTISGLLIAGQRGPVACTRAEALPFRDHSFDAVVAQHLVEHLPESSAWLAEWQRVLRPGGRIVIVTPNADFADPSLFADPTHVHLFTPTTLKAALEGAGYRVESIFTLFPYLGSSRLGRAASVRLASITRWLPGRSGAGRSIVASATLPF